MYTREAVTSGKTGCQNFLLWMNTWYERQYTACRYMINSSVGLFDYAPTECIVLGRYHMAGIQREKSSYLTHIT
jgi:hypothetical protein